MKGKFKKLINKPFVRNVILLASGTAAAQAINFILAPIITRLYGPEAYGLMGVFMSIVTIITPVAALTYPIAIVLPKSDSVAKGLVRLSLFITVIIASITTIIILLFKNKIVELFQLNEIASYLFLIPLVILFAGLLQVTEQWLIRTKQFGITAKVSVLQALIINGSKVGIGFLYPSAIVLIVLSAISNGFKAFMLNFFAKKRDNNLDERVIEEISLKKLAKKHRDFPIYRAPEAFLHAITQGLPVLLLGGFFGAASAGFYSIGRTVLQLPSLLIGKSVGDVFYPRISEAANNNENLTGLIKRATTMLGLCGLIPYGVIILFGPWLFGLVFGESWINAGEYARWMALGLFFGFMKEPSIKALPVLSAQAFHFKFAVITLIIRIGSLILGYYVFKNDIVAVAFFGITGAILNMGLILITLTISRKFDRKIKRNILLKESKK